MKDVSQVVANFDHGQALTYMSTFDTLATKVAELCASGQLFEWSPAIRDVLSYSRTLWLTSDVLDVVNSTTAETWTAIRHMQFGASLDAFINWEEISVAENPFNKEPDAFLARVAPVERELWDIRTIEPPQGMRCIGGFVDRDEFVGLVWDYRENVKSGQFDALVERGYREWQRLFGPLTPHRGDSLDAYLTNYIAA
jgi:hypothetical protein